MEEKILSDFVSQTNADPAFAQDLLEATDWDILSALAAFEGLNVTHEEHQLSDPDINLSEYDEIDVAEVDHLLSGGVAPVSDEGPDVKKREKKTKAKGLAHVAEEVGELFCRVAVSDAKLSYEATKKEKVFNDQFFKHSFLLPDFKDESEDLNAFILSDITEKSHKQILEKLGRLNWWASTGKLPSLEPLATSGDGNCLLHAASLYMWGLPDNNLILRTHLHRLLTNSVEKDGIHRRWRYLTTLRNQEAGGLTFSEEEWEFEWHEIMRIATSQPRRQPTTNSLRRYSSLRPHYESLEEVHVFAMAHVLHRPIIVVADNFLRNMHGEPLAPIYFGGIYLPLECSAAACYKSPLILAYDSSHFSPLVAKKDPVVVTKGNSRLRHSASKRETVMPLVTPDGALLPILFCYDPKKRDFPEQWAKEKCPPGDFPDEIRTLLESYMDIRWIQLDIGAKFGSQNEHTEEGSFKIPVKVPKVRFPAAVVSNTGEPEYQVVLVEKYLEDARKRFEEDKERRAKVAEQQAKQEEEYKRLQANRPVPCQGKDCTMYGTLATNSLCSKCYALSQNAEAIDTPTSQTPPVRHLPKEIPAQGSGSAPPIRRLPNPSSSPAKKPPNTKQLHSEVPPELNVRQVDTSKWEIALPDIQMTTMEDSSTEPQTSTQEMHSSAHSQTSKVRFHTTSKTHSQTSETHSDNASTIPSSSSETHPQVSATSSPQRKAPSPSSRNVQSKPEHSPVHKSTVPPPTRGYSRDNIQPIKMVSSSGHTVCQNKGCTYFGSADMDGFCSQCYRSKHPSITQV